MRFYRIILNFIDNYRTLFLNPSANAAEIIVTTALFLVGFVVLRTSIVLGFGAVKNLAHRLRAEPRFRLQSLLFVGGSIVLAGAFFAVAVPVVSNSSFCGRVCHSMNPQFQSWRRSSHADVGCDACHASSILTRRIAQKARVGFTNIKLEVTGGYRKPINARSTYSRRKELNANCLKCHSNDKEFGVKTAGMKISHKKHTNVGLDCANCHNRVAHSTADKYSPLKKKKDTFKYKDFLTMSDGCWRCHQTGGKFVDAGGKLHKGPFQAKSGSIAATGCSICHTTEWKDKPESHTASRGEQWARGLAHGEAARRDFGQCEGCHEKTVSCATTCHSGVIMPHSRKWVANHSTYANENMELCRRCHRQIVDLDFCDERCHEEFVWPKDLQESLF